MKIFFIIISIFLCMSVSNSDTHNYAKTKLTRNWGKKKDRKDFIDWTGKITSSGEIVWESKDLTDSKFNNITEGDLMEEAEDFLTAVKRIQQETGLDFNFSYNNRGGERRIIIQGRI